MTTQRVEEQIAVIRNAANKANKSRESATAFLRNAGIIGDNDDVVKTESCFDTEVSTPANKTKSSGR
ncbi:hypothetical protein [Mucilaginibacter sp.]|uniref:hypothetical protein n=1 Tax=Mucilaginibacter sp. TaxID=1882438 RepID=UPI002847FE59|nr:hypothetical protein [Mucilaginibacter sp.]MDR3693021.1 hypothetical protein [Mucilaginibacter sp.]